MCPDDDPVTWLLNHGSYSSQEKTRILDCYHKYNNAFDKRRKKRCGTFRKDEFYVSKKTCRLINARNDLFKAINGPMINEINHVIYRHPAFVKLIPMVKRPAYIKKQMQSSFPAVVEGDDALFRVYGKTFATDLSSCEALHTLSIKRDVIEPLYRHVLGKTEFNQKWCDDFFKLTKGRQYMVSRVNKKESQPTIVSVEATLMSGEVDTSTANGFLSLALINYMFERESRGLSVTSDIYTALGMRAKLVEHANEAEASFCGMLFDPKELLAVRDPAVALAKLGWTRAPYVFTGRATRLKLLRMKALSLAYESGRCPILWAVAQRLLKLTSSLVKSDKYLEKYMDKHERSKFHVHSSVKMVLEPPGPLTRELFCHLFDVPVPDQLAAERIASSMNLGPAPTAFVKTIPFPDFWADVYSEYVTSSVEACVAMRVPPRTRIVVLEAPFMRA